MLGPFKASTGMRVGMKHTGTSNFIVTPYLLSGRDGGLVNEIGSFSGVQVYRPSGLFFIKVDADGGWVIEMTPL